MGEAVVYGRRGNRGHTIKQGTIGRFTRCVGVVEIVDGAYAIVIDLETAIIEGVASRAGG